MDRNNVWIVIAAYNEERVIGQTVSEVLAEFPNVVVVDDCSKDKTSEIAHSSGAHVVRHPVNLGQGAALQTGISYALAKDCEYLVTFDADGQHDHREISPMLTALEASTAQIALGNRFLGNAINMNNQRRRLLRLAGIFTKLTTGLHIEDSHNGFRAIRRSFFDNFEFQQNRMAHASEIFGYISRSKIQFIQHPVTITYTDYSISKGQRGSNALRIVMELFTGYLSK